MQTPDFDAVYRADSDPWSVGSSFYEQRKLALVLATLSRPAYRLAWDPGCGTGHLAAALSGRADRVVGSDVSEAGVRIARRTCAGLTNVRLLVAPMQAEPDGSFGGAGDSGDSAGSPDLVVVSEFLYYLSARDRTAALGVVDRWAAAEAELLAVHWRPHPHDAWLSGAAVQAEIGEFLDARGWRHRVHLDDPDFVLDSLRRPS